MKKIRIFFLIAFIHITLINAQVNLSISSTNASAGDTINLEISIDNPNTTLGGFQFIINDTPNQLDLLNVVQQVGENPVYPNDGTMLFRNYQTEINDIIKNIFQTTYDFSDYCIQNW